MNKELLLEDVKNTDITTHKLVLHNDNHNTFTWVIDCLCSVLKISSIVAEQISYIVHFKGKAIVKHDSLEKLKTIKNALIERGLNVTIESC